LSRMPPHRQLTSQASHGSGIGSVIRPVSSSSMPWTPSRTMCTPNFVSDPWQCRIVPYRRSARTLGESAGWVSPADGPMNGTARGSCNPPGHPIAATSGCDSGQPPAPLFALSSAVATSSIVRATAPRATVGNGCSDGTFFQEGGVALVR